MSKAYDFLKECGYYYLLTMNGDFPAGRPFGSIYEHDGLLYLCTGDSNQVHLQLRKNGNVQLLAKKDGTRQWLRITGRASEVTDPSVRLLVFEECPSVKSHVTRADDEHFLVFQVEILDAEFHP